MKGGERHGESNQNQEVGGGCGVQSEEGKLSVHAAQRARADEFSRVKLRGEVI